MSLNWSLFPRCGKAGAVLAAMGCVFALSIFSVGLLSVSAVAQGPDAAGTIASDPLFAKTGVTLDDLRLALEDPVRSPSVIDQHFSRVLEATEQERKTFLAEALQHESLPVRQQAVEQLQWFGWLEEVVLSAVERVSPDNAFQVKMALVDGEATKMPPSITSEESIVRLLRQIESGSPEESFSSQSQLDRLGASAIPGLLHALKDERLAAIAASELGRLLSQLQATSDPELAGMGIEASAPVVRSKGPGAESGASGPQSTEQQTMVRRFGDDEPAEVDVFFATNRQRDENETNPDRRLMFGGVLISLAVLAMIFSYGGVSSESSEKRSGCGGGLKTLLVVLIALVGLYLFNAAWMQKYSLHEGVKFGSRRAEAGRVSYGLCKVSIPPSHQVGQVERPSIGAEDADSHVVLRSTEVIQDQVFFQDVRRVLDQEQTGGECFVFVHGYNVRFEDAARRTAQIHYDLGFSGVPMFFSWPSRGSFRHYFSDRNEILVSHEAIKQFLVDVAKKSNAKRIHVIAHSMGADATCRAISDLEIDGPVFEQIVLAAPDIDAAYFSGSLLPKLLPKAKRTTLYCSSNDWALYASDRFNDGPRAGDSRDQIIVEPGLDTVDASEMDTELLGHSYYGNCMPLIDDVRLLLTENRSPQDRELVAQQTERDIPFWRFRLEKKTPELPSP